MCGFFWLIECLCEILSMDLRSLTSNWTYLPVPSKQRQAYQRLRDDVEKSLIVTDEGIILTGKIPDTQTYDITLPKSAYLVAQCSANHRYVSELKQAEKSKPVKQGLKTTNK